MMKENRSFVPWLSPVSVSLEKNYRTRVADHVRNQRPRHGFDRSFPSQTLIRKVKIICRICSLKLVMSSRFSTGTSCLPGVSLGWLLVRHVLLTSVNVDVRRDCNWPPSELLGIRKKTAVL